MNYFILNEKIDGIPTIIQYNKKYKDKKPLIFLFHGFTSSKDAFTSGLSKQIADLGYFVVQIDAPFHGERKKDWYDNLSFDEKYKYIVDIEIETALNAKKLWNEYFKKDSRVKSEMFYSFGSSMGAAVSFYLATIEKDLKVLRTLVGSPSYYQYFIDKTNKENWVKDETYFNRIKKYKEICPLLNKEKLKNKTISFGLGKEDETVLPKYSIELYESYKNNYEIKLYDAGHELTNEMILDTISYLNKNIN